MFGGLRSFLIGYHSPIFHTYYVTLAWRNIYGKYPTCREFICILLHDIGYIIQSDSNVSNEDDVHPLLGAEICRFLFGKEYYNFCIGHSRDYSRKMNIPISKLCYADKYAVLLISWNVHRIIYLLDSPQVTKDIIVEFRESCRLWWKKNGWIVNYKGSD